MKWRHHNTRTTKQLVDKKSCYIRSTKCVYGSIQKAPFQIWYQWRTKKTYRSTVQLIWPFRILRGSKNQGATSTMGLRAVGTVSNKLSNAEQSSNWTPPPASTTNPATTQRPHQTNRLEMKQEILIFLPYMGINVQVLTEVDFYLHLVLYLAFRHCTLSILAQNIVAPAYLT